MDGFSLALSVKFISVWWGTDIESPKEKITSMISLQLLLVYVKSITNMMPCDWRKDKMEFQWLDLIYW